MERTGTERLEHQIYGRGQEKPAEKSEEEAPPPPQAGGKPAVCGRKAKRWEWLAVRCCLEVELNKEGLIRGHWISQQGGQW